MPAVFSFQGAGEWMECAACGMMQKKETGTAMGFWIFMLANTVLIPVIMILAGRSFSRKAPGKINPFFGYRTAMSMKNEETWDYAHRLCGRIWTVLGWIMLPVSVIAMLFAGKEEGAVGRTGGIVTAVQAVLLIGSILPVEAALRKRFDRDGKRRENETGSDA